MVNDYQEKRRNSAMPQPIELDQVDGLVRHYQSRLNRFRSGKPSLRRSVIERTVQVLEHYLKLCRTIDRDPEDS